MKDFFAKATTLPNAVLIEISGQIDEHANFSPIQSGKEVPLIFDLEGITRINSVGIRTWMVWFAKNAVGRSVTFRNCPKVVVDQFNMVANFLPKNAKVESFYVPYFCESCSHEARVLLKAGVDFNQSSPGNESSFQLPKTPNCEKCALPMDLDVIEKLHFRFLKHA